MPIKIIISFLVLNLLFSWVGYSMNKDSIRQIELAVNYVAANNPANDKFDKLEYPFFDVDVQRFYYKISIDHSDSSLSSNFLFIEIKKKSIQQFRLRPIVSKKIELNRRTLVIDSLDIPDSLFSSGNFDLIVSLMHDSMKVNDVKKSPFQLLRNQTKTVQDQFYAVDTFQHENDFDISKTFVFKYDIKQIKKNIAALTPLTAGTSEQKAIQELALSENLDVLKRYFYNFWVNKNPSDPEQAWFDYSVILNDVAKKYGNASTPGYETDRGRIYIKYGPPDKLERVTTEKNALPYEIWFYYRSGNKSNLKFLFFQSGMLSSSMILLNSNLPDEIINPSWKSMLLQDGGENKMLHKVFEYFN